MTSAGPTLATPGLAMPAPRDGGGRDSLVLGLLAAFIGLYGWAVFAASFHHDGLIGPRVNAPGIDFMVYVLAARDWLEGTPALIADPVALTARLNHDFAGWLSEPVPLHPWLYPPPFLLLMLPFARLPFGAALALFLMLSCIAAILAGWLWAARGGGKGLWLAGLVLAPGASVTALAGQNAFLTLALLLGGFGLRRRSGLAGGAILGLLCYKPQLALLVPVALLALRDGRALAGAAVGAACVALLSAVVLGLEPWRDWLGVMATDQGSAFAAWLDAGRLWGLSAWACAMMLGAPPFLASLVQAAAMLLAAGAVYRGFRGGDGGARPMALLLAATLLAAPHVSPYDLLLLDAAMLLLFADLLAGAEVPCRPTLLLLPWAAPLLGVPHNGPAGFLAPLSVLGCVLLLAGRPPALTRVAAGSGDTRRAAGTG